ncbi:MAG TPA: hypothetical protein VNJ54_18710 [Plantibacter sp.]|uniref:hypothetical protein n=1 Tax=unclassified Plantibacter TaxID=2624265 RepID=UPI002C5324E9|nr:hypothetical protein [Plantibacter sp.]
MLGRELPVATTNLSGGDSERYAFSHHFRRARHAHDHCVRRAEEPVRLIQQFNEDERTEHDEQQRDERIHAWRAPESAAFHIAFTAWITEDESRSFGALLDATLTEPKTLLG